LRTKPQIFPERFAIVARIESVARLVTQPTTENEEGEFCANGSCVDLLPLEVETKK